MSQLRAASINLVYLMPIAEVTQNQAALTSFINATYPTDNKIDVTSAWVNATDLSGDNIDPTLPGRL